MNFKDLKIIANQIKKEITCPKCKGKYVDESLEIIGSPDGEQYFFHALCPKCEADSIVHVAVETKPSKLPNFKKLGSSPRLGHISSNEVLDMHNFLKEFDGNFKTLFKKQH